MSHIAVDLKVIEVHAPAVARGAGVSEDRVLAGLVRLWHRCWSTKAVAVTEVEIAGAFGPERLGELIRSMETEFLRKQADGTFHVCGADQYLRIREGHSKGGHASKSNLIPGGKKRSAPAERQPKNSRDQAETPPRQSSALPPNTEHRTPNTEVTTSVAVATELDLEVQPRPDTRTETEKLEDAMTDDEFDVFAEWAQLYRPKAVPTVERRKLIAKWLRVYSVEQLQCAIRGVQRSPHHMGHNERRTKYDGLELILRDAEHIEKFMRLTEEAA